MSLHAKTYSLNALSVELGHDRRTLGRWLRDLAPAEKGADGAPRWRMQDVVACIDRRRATPAAGSDPSLESEIGEWIGHELMPAIFGSETFFKTLAGGLRSEFGLGKAQTLRVYMLTLLALTAELERAGVSCGIVLPSLAEQIAKEGVDAVVARWPDSPRG